MSGVVAYIICDHFAHTHTHTHIQNKICRDIYYLVYVKGYN